MSSAVYLSLVLPACNEAGSIRSTLAALRSYLDRQRYSYEKVMHALTDLHQIKDTQCGFKFLTRESADRRPDRTG